MFAEANTNIMNRTFNGGIKWASALALVVVLAGCGQSQQGQSSTGGAEASSGKREFLSIGTAPVGGVFYTIGGALSDVLNQFKGENNWSVAAESTGGSMENIRRLDSGEIQFAVSNSSITYFAVRGEEGWEKKYEVRSVMTLFPNVAMFVTRQGVGITRISDLKGKRVSVGPEGAGFEYFIRPILKAHGLTYADFEPVYAGQQTSVDYMGDGSIAAAFLGGGVPTGSITSATSTMDILLVPYDEDVKKKLIADYAFFDAATIPAGTYKGQDAAYEGLDVGSAHLITSAAADDELVYQFVKTIYENRATLAEKHKAGKAVNAKNVVRNTGTEFHPGAIRFYQEAGIWPQGR
jgi:uncharacterized protein